MELKIKVKSPVSRPAIMLQTKTESNGGSPKETSSADQSSGEDSPELDKELDKEETRSPQFWPEKAPLPTPRLTREVTIEFLKRHLCKETLRCEFCQRWFCRCQSVIRRRQTRMGAEILRQVKTV